MVYVLDNSGKLAQNTVDGNLAECIATDEAGNKYLRVSAVQCY